MNFDDLFNVSWEKDKIGIVLMMWIVCFILHNLLDIPGLLITNILSVVFFLIAVVVIPIYFFIVIVYCIYRGVINVFGN